MPETESLADDRPTQNARLRTLASTISSLLWYTAPDGSIAIENPSWETFTGQSLAEYSGWGWLLAIHPEDRERLSVAWSAAVASRTVIEAEYRLRRRDGVYRDMATHGAPVLDQGELREWVGLCIDVTENKRAAAVLRQSEERFRFLDRLGQATRGLTEATDVMAQTARFLGEYLGATRCAYADVEADGNRFTIRSDWSREGVASSVGVYSLDLFGPLATSRLRRGEHLVVRDVDAELGDEGGGRMFNSIGVKAIICSGLVKDGRLVAMMAVHQSTPRDWSAEEISIVTEVVERCWAHIERVRDSAILKEQDRQKDDFLATLAHELRNPLAPIMYATAMMRTGAGARTMAQAQDVIDRQVGTMSRLIDDLLDLSRVSRGLVQLKCETVGVRQLMQQAVETARPALQAGAHRFELQLPQEDLQVFADPVRLVQVIGNLLTNAAKYTPDGGRIVLQAARQAGSVVLEVSDTGIGIPPEEQGKLFQMFMQLQHTRAHAKGGLGIGLALVKKLVEMHGGSVRVHSEGLNRGSSFCLAFPLHASAEPAEAAAPLAPLDEPSRAAAAGGGLRVLVVEDNEDGLESLLALLETMGYRVAGAADGLDALAVADTFDPELILLDLGLPKMDGLEVARTLRDRPRFKDVFIVALTGWGAERDRARTRAAGFNEHLTKPIEPLVLQQLLEGWSRGLRPDAALA